MRTDYHHDSNFRFKLVPFITRDGDTVIMVKDGFWVSDADVREGRTAPTVAQFHTLAQCNDYCDSVIAGEIFSEPHEAWFEGWPGLSERVDAERKAREERRRKGPGTWQ